MATNGYNQEEYRKQMEQLERSMPSMANLGQEKGEQGKDSSVKSPLSSQEYFHETIKYQFREPKHPKPDDEKDFFISQVKAVTAALSVPLSSVITLFEVDPRKFKQWLKEGKKYALMSGKPGHKFQC